MPKVAGIKRVEATKSVQILRHSTTHCYCFSFFSVIRKSFRGLGGEVVGCLDELEQIESLRDDDTFVGGCSHRRLIEKNVKGKSIFVR